MIDYSKKTVPQLKALIVKAHHFMGMDKPSFKGMRKPDLVARILVLRKAAEVASAGLKEAQQKAELANKGARATESLGDRAGETVSSFVVKARQRAANIRKNMAAAKAKALAIGHVVRVELNN